MSDDKIVLPGVEDDVNDLLEQLRRQLEAKKPRNQLRTAYYDAKAMLHQITKVLPPHYYKLGMVLGWSAKAVDILARRCNLDGFALPGTDLDALGASTVWRENNLGSEVNAALISSLIHATAFQINSTGAEGEPKALIHTKSAMDATGVWDPRLRRLTSLLSVTARKGGNPSELVLYLPNRTITAQKASRRWVVVDEKEHTWGVPAEPLVYQPRVGRPFGSSRISRPVMALQDQATRTVLRMEGHMDVYSFPEFVLLGAKMDIFQNADGSAMNIWDIMLGRWKGIPDNDDDPNASNPRADVKQFPASDPSPHIAALKQQAQLFSGETSIPLTSLGVSDMSNPTSADSYVASREDLIAEAEGATDDWSPALSRTMARALAMAQGEESVPAEWLAIEPVWRSPIYLSRAAAADAGMKQLTAVPWLANTEVGLELLGLDAQQIRRAMADRSRAQGSGVLQVLQDAAAARTAVATAAPAAPAELTSGSAG